MLLSAVSVLVVAQSSSDVSKGLLNNPVYIFVFECVILEISVLKGSFLCLSPINRKYFGSKYYSQSFLRRELHRSGTVGGTNPVFTRICPNDISKKERSSVNGILSHVRHIQFLPKLEVSSELIIPAKQDGSQK